MAMATADSNPTPWTATGAEKRESVRDLFSDVAPSYDRLNRWLSMRRDQRWRQIAARSLQLEPGDAALDVCCGTGDFVAALLPCVGLTGHVVALDFCLPMVALAHQKPELSGPVATMGLGDACQLPIASGSFDGATVGWGLRNVADLSGALNEIARCLKPGGRFATLDMAIPRNPILRLGSRLVSSTALPALGALFGLRKAYTYLPKSAERFADRETLAQKMRDAGFDSVTYRDFMGGAICLHTGVKR